MGVAAIPRNYELFYEAYIGSNPTLTRELAALGSSATQEELDAIGAKYFSVHAGRIFDDAHVRLTTELDAILRALRQEQATLESYNRLLGETTERITSRSNNSADLLRNAIDMLTVATGDTMAQGEKTVENVAQRSQEMDEVRKELDEYKRIANTDALTRLSNRRAFEDRLASVFGNRLTRPTTALVLADIDHFKKINDTHGHAAGDDAIKRIAEIINQSIRTTDKAARFGGEEFVVLLREIDQETALRLAERIRNSIEQTTISHGEANFVATVSIGVAINAEGDRDVQDMIERADQGLYIAKKTGRNRTVLTPAREQETRAA
jgi:diguanylate cyclase